MSARVRPAVLGALCCLAGMALVGIVAQLVPGGEEIDARVLRAFTRLRFSDLNGALETIVHFGDEGPYLAFSTAIVVTAISRQRPRLAAIVAVALVVGPTLAEIIKLATAHSRDHSVRFADHISRASWPSGHTTGAMTAALCAVVVSPRGLRPLVAVLGGAIALAMGATVMALVWHFPSDVIGAYFLSGAVVFAAVAASRRWPDAPPVPEPGSRHAALAAAAGATVVLVLAALVALQPGRVADRVGANETLLAAGAGMFALTAAVTAAVVWAARES